MRLCLIYFAEIKAKNHNPCKMTAYQKNLEISPSDAKKPLLTTQSEQQTLLFHSVLMPMKYLAEHYGKENN